MRFAPGAVLAIALLLAPAALAQTMMQTRWDMATEYPRTSMSGLGVETFARHVGENTRGGLVIRPSYEADGGLRSSAIMAAITRDRLQAGDAYAGALDRSNELFALFSLPAVVGDLDGARRLLDLARPAIAATLRERGARLLYLTPWPPTGLWSRKALRSGADLKGLTVRTYDLTSSITIGATGADAAILSHSEMAARLRDGSIDAVLSSGEGGLERKLWSALPHFSEVVYTVPISIASANANAYAALPPDLKAAVDLAAHDTEAELWSALIDRLAETRRQMQANGVAVDARPSPELLLVLKQGAGEMHQRWCAKAGTLCQAILVALEHGSPSR
jgi:TRAP-type C4-dicarboxylate transport system substrate-binding protein